MNVNMLAKADGRALRMDDVVYRVIGKDRDNPVMILEDENGTRSELPIIDFRIQIAAGNVSEGSTADFTTYSQTAASSAEQKFREAVLAQVNILREDGHLWDAAVRLAKARLSANPEFEYRARSFPSKRTIQLWLKNAQRIGSRALVDKRTRSGNRSYRHDLILEDIVFDLLETKFMTSDRMTITQLTKEAGFSYRSRCADNNVEPAAHGRKVITSIISALPHSDVLKMRVGSKEARRRLNQATAFQRISHPLDRIEIDSTIADIFVIIDEDGKSARPHVTAAIDAVTGVLVGLHISLEHPTAFTTATVLKEVMSLRPPEFFDRFEIENRLNAIGRPLTVVSDQGSENVGDIIRSLITETDIEFRRMIPGRPEKKPFIERFFRTFSDFVTQLPGATKTHLFPNRSRIKLASNEAAIHFDEFIAKVQKWRFDVYAQTKRRRILSPLRRRESPSESWRRLEKECLIPEPPTPQELNQIFFVERITRGVWHYGIQVDGIQYHSNALAQMANSQNVKKVTVHRDPTDIRMIGVVNPKSDELIFVPAKDPNTPAISIEELKRIRKSYGKTTDDETSALEILASLTVGHHHKPKTPTTKQKKLLRSVQEKRRNAHIADKSGKPHAVEQSLIESTYEPQKAIKRPANLATLVDKNEP